MVLTAWLSDALIILFIDEGLPSYLGLSSLDDQVVYYEFPDAAALSFWAPRSVNRGVTRSLRSLAGMEGEALRSEGRAGVDQASQWAIRTGRLTKRYRGVPEVDTVNLAVAPRRAFGFLGPNGAGKIFP